MRITEAPNPPPPSRTRTMLVALEPWQVEALDRINRALGLSDGAVLRAGLTLALGLIGAAGNLPGHLGHEVIDGEPVTVVGEPMRWDAPDSRDRVHAEKVHRLTERAARRLAARVSEPMEAGAAP